MLKMCRVWCVNVWVVGDTSRADKCLSMLWVFSFHKAVRYSPYVFFLSQYSSGFSLTRQISHHLPDKNPNNFVLLTFSRHVKYVGLAPTNSVKIW